MVVRPATLLGVRELESYIDKVDVPRPHEHHSEPLASDILVPSPDHVEEFGVGSNR